MENLKANLAAESIMMNKTACTYWEKHLAKRKWRCKIYGFFIWILMGILVSSLYAFCKCLFGISYVFPVGCGTDPVSLFF